ncbi:hypothetical protein F5887DRAFT_834749, partial [Amanita rubescens]
VTIGSNDHTYKLRGIIYFGDYHFTSRIVYENGMTWFHDGMVTAESMIYDGMIDQLSDLWFCRGKKASIAFY